MLKVNCLPLLKSRSFTAIISSFQIFLYICSLIFAGIEPNGECLAPHRISLFYLGEKYSYYILYHNQYWRLFTSLFLHANLDHIIINQISLLIVCSELESLLGWRKMLSYFLLYGIQGTIFSSYFNSEPSVSASLPTIFFLIKYITLKLETADNLPLSIANEKGRSPYFFNNPRSLFKNFESEEVRKVISLETCGALLLCLINIVISKMRSTSIDVEGMIFTLLYAFVVERGFRSWNQKIYKTIVISNLICTFLFLVKFGDADLY